MIAFEIRRIAVELSVKEREALRTVLKTPGWEKAVQEFFKEKETKEARLREPLMMALLLLSQSIGATTAPEMISEIHKMEQHQVQKAVPRQDIKEIEQAIPFSFNPAEKKLLELLPVSFNKFKQTLSKKIIDGLEKSVIPTISKKNWFDSVGTDRLADAITEAFFNKLEDPKYHESVETLDKYLKGTGKTREDLKRAVNTALVINLPSVVEKI